MDKITKFLQRLTPAERQRLQIVRDQLLAGNFDGLDIKPLTAKPDLFRVRVGSFRLIFSGKKSGVIQL